MAYDDMGDRCVVCGASVTQSGGRGRARRYCSDVCRQRACRLRRVTKLRSRTLVGEPEQAGLSCNLDEANRWRFLGLGVTAFSG